MSVFGVEECKRKCNGHGVRALRSCANHVISSAMLNLEKKVNKYKDVLTTSAFLHPVLSISLYLFSHIVPRLLFVSVFLSFISSLSFSRLPSIYHLVFSCCVHVFLTRSATAIRTATAKQAGPLQTVNTQVRGAVWTVDLPDSPKVPSPAPPTHMSVCSPSLSAICLESAPPHRAFTALLCSDLHVQR